jgi:hypothetical protein
VKVNIDKQQLGGDMWSTILDYFFFISRLFVDVLPHSSDERANIDELRVLTLLSIRFRNVFISTKTCDVPIHTARKYLTGLHILRGR